MQNRNIRKNNKATDSNNNQKPNLNSPSSFHHEMLLKQVIENNQEYINKYISEIFQRKFINYLLEHTETLSHIINDKDLKYINFFNIEDISKNNPTKTTVKDEKNNNGKRLSVIKNNNKIKYVVNKVKRKNSISVLEMNNNKIKNLLLNHLSNNSSHEIKDKKYYSKKEFFQKEYFWWTPKYFQPFEKNLKRKAFGKLLIIFIYDINCRLLLLL